MVHIRRNHQQNDKQKSIIVRLLLIVVLFAVSSALLYRYYTDGMHKDAQVYPKWSDELINRTYLPSCYMSSDIQIKGHFSWCKDTVSGEVAWFASEWNFNTSEKMKDSLIFSDIRYVLSTQISDSISGFFHTENILPEMIQIINSSFFSEKLILILGPIASQPDSSQYGKKIIFFVAFDPEINNLLAYKIDLSANEDQVWKKTSIDNLERIFSIDFFHHYLSPKIEKVIESRE